MRRTPSSALWRLAYALACGLICLALMTVSSQEGSDRVLGTLFASALQEKRGGSAGDDKAGSSRGTSSSSSKWNGDIIQWVGYKAAKSLADSQLERELEEARERAQMSKKTTTEDGKRKKKRSSAKKTSDKVNNDEINGNKRRNNPTARAQPFLFLFHKSYCPACKALERSFRNSMPIEVLSEYFTMVSVGDDEDPADPMYEPQGAYFPRIMFAAPNGTVLSDAIKNDTPVEEGHDHYFADADSIVVAMKKTLQLVGGFTTFRGL